MRFDDGLFSFMLLLGLPEATNSVGVLRGGRRLTSRDVESTQQGVPQLDADSSSIRTLGRNSQVGTATGEVVEPLSQPGLPNGCDGLLEFREHVGNDYEEGGLQHYGDRTLWSKNPVFDIQGTLVGSVAGVCTMIAVADVSTAAVLLCNVYYHWTAGPFKNSTLVAEGVLQPEDATSFTIVGGSGCFAGLSGLVNSRYVPSIDDYRTSIELQ